jgi:hypothetical protein
MTELTVQRVQLSDCPTPGIPRRQLSRFLVLVIQRGHISIVDDQHHSSIEMCSMDGRYWSSIEMSLDSGLLPVPEEGFPLRMDGVGHPERAAL